MWERFKFRLRNLNRVNVGRDHYIRGGPITGLKRNNKFLWILIAINFAFFFYHIYCIVDTGEWFYYILAGINLAVILFMMYTIGYTKSVVNRSRNRVTQVMARPFVFQKMMKRDEEDDIIKRATVVKIVKNAKVDEDDKKTFEDWQKSNR